MGTTDKMQSKGIAINNNSKKESQVNSYAISELSFFLLPFVVMIVAFSIKKSLSDIFTHPEWSIASSIMFGQCITKTIYMLSKLTGKVLHYRIGLVLSLIIVFGLVPSLTILSLIFVTDIIPIWLCILQIALFIIASIVFFIINGLQITVEEEEENNR